MKVLIAPLNWGIGHATRSIPLIQLHLQRGDQVFIASSGQALVLLQKHFPLLTCYTLPDYGIKYHKNIPVWLSVFLQGGKIMSAIRQEQIRIQELNQSHLFDLIISDNRYGIYHPDVKSQLICHQLNPISPFKFTRRLIERIHRYLCKPFHEILVPDYLEEESKLSGTLSSPSLNWSPQIVKYIKPLSQLNVLPTTEKQIKGHILVLLSGIEPQRSILEQYLLKTFKNKEYSVTIVGGKVLNTKKPNTDFKYYSFLNKEALELEINKAEFILCRSGYSTIMDIHNLVNKHIIFIPTPGQTEQEYLAKYLSDKFEHMYMQTQHNLCLTQLIENITNRN